MFPWRKEKEDAVYVIGVPMLMGPPTERPVKNIGRSGKASNPPHLLRHIPFVVFYCALDWGTFWACVFHFRGFDSTFL